MSLTAQSGPRVACHRLPHAYPWSTCSMPRPVLGHADITVTLRSSVMSHADTTVTLRSSVMSHADITVTLEI